MDFRLRAAPVLAALALFAGCRQNNAQRELLERELRLQEDRIYQLEAQLQDACRALESSGVGSSIRTPTSTYEPGRSSSASTSREPERAGVPDLRTPVEVPSRTGSTVEPPKNHSIAPPAVEMPTPSLGPPTMPPPSGSLPQLTPPSPNVPEGLPGSRSTTGPPESRSTVPQALPSGSPPSTPPPMKPMSSPRFVPPSARPRALGDAAASEPPPAAMPRPIVSAQPQVQSLHISTKTVGVNLDGRPGDDGLVVVLEPRTSRGEVVPAVGELSIVLIDPAAPDDVARYARWDFASADAAAMHRPPEAGVPTGSYFELAWPDNPPTHAKLKLFVRLVTDDGRRLEANRDVVVNVAQLGAALRQNPRELEAPFAETIPASALNWGSPRRPSSQYPVSSSTPSGSKIPTELSGEAIYHTGPIPAAGLTIPAGAATRVLSGPSLFPALR